MGLEASLLSLLHCINACDIFWNWPQVFHCEGADLIQVPVVKVRIPKLFLQSLECSNKRERCSKSCDARAEVRAPSYQPGVTIDVCWHLPIYHRLETSLKSSFVKRNFFLSTVVSSPAQTQSLDNNCFVKGRSTFCPFNEPDSFSCKYLVYCKQ